MTRDDVLNDLTEAVTYFYTWFNSNLIVQENVRRDFLFFDELLELMKPVGELDTFLRESSAHPVINYRIFKGLRKLIKNKIYDCFERLEFLELNNSLTPSQIKLADSFTVMANTFFEKIDLAIPYLFI